MSDAVSPFAVESDNSQSSTGQFRHQLYGLGRCLLCGQGLHCVTSRFGNDQSHRYLSNTRCGGRSYPVVSVQFGCRRFCPKVSTRLRLWNPRRLSLHSDPSRALQRYLRACFGLCSASVSDFSENRQGRLFQASFCPFPLIDSLGKLQVRVWQPKRLAEPLDTFSGKQCMISFLHYESRQTYRVLCMPKKSDPAPLLVFPSMIPASAST